MLKQALYILKNEHLRLAFFNYTSKLSKKSATRVFESTLFTYNRKRLTRRTTYKQINLTFVLCCIQFMNVRMPLVLSNIIVCKVGLFTISIYVSSKNDLRF